MLPRPPMPEDQTECIFCKIISGQAWAAIVYDDGKYVAFMDRYPAYVGHTLVAPRKHYSTLFDMPEDEVERLFGVAARVAKAVKAALRPRGLNLIQNNGRAAMQIVPHVHVHVVPRYHLPPRSSKGRMHVSKEYLQNLANRIKSKLPDVAHD